MLSASQSWTAQHFRNFLLIALSLHFLPLNAIITAFAYLISYLPIVRPPIAPQRNQNGRQIRVLVTGVGMAKGLFLCRALYLGGCRVIGADLKRRYINVPCGRFSRAVENYYSISDPTIAGVSRYVADVLEIVKQEHIDLCITCSGVATAVEDAMMTAAVERTSPCKAIQLSEKAVRTLDDKLSFMAQLDSLGLTCPEWFSITSKKEISTTIDKIRQKSSKFIIKNAGMDDRSRGTLPLLDPRRRQEVSGVLERLDYDTSWLLQEYFPGGEEYCSHALVLNGEVRAFSACPSASILMHYESLNPKSIQHIAMLNFTRAYAQSLYSLYGACTGHLSFDFCVRYKEKTISLIPIECNPRCHTATLLFRGKEKELTKAYISILTNDKNVSKIVQPRIRGTEAYYWMAHDIILPFSHLGFTETKMVEALKNFAYCIWHFFAWKDATFEWWDPLPWFILNHVSWPLELFKASITRTKWKQLNVSTMKVFKI